DEWDLGFRIASGSADPASTNQTLADSFSSKDLWLDLAYFNWHPLTMPGLNVYGGKMKNPFYKVGKNELIWDGDVNPEGIAAKYVIPFGKYDKLHIGGGGFWVDEDSGGVDTSLWGAQAYLNHAFENGNYLLGGVSYFDYGNIKGRGDLKSTWSSSGSFFGNSATGGTFDSDYDIVEAFGEYGFKVSEMPLAVFGNYAQNIAASTSEDTGWLIGFKLNKAKNPGSWEFRYNYRDLEADAVLGAFADSDFIGGGTDGKGHEFGLAYQLTKRVQAAITYFLNERDRSGTTDDDYRRLQFDLKYKF
ncbi:MAG: putative porin, partial [Planctomycetota bacterium]